MSVIANNAPKDDFVESTRINALMGGTQIGESLLNWKQPNSMWCWEKDDAVFEWGQVIDMSPTSYGLIEFELSAKLNSQTDYLPVAGRAYCKISKAENELSRKFKKNKLGLLDFFGGSVEKPTWTLP